MRRLHPATRAALVVIAFFGVIVALLVWWLVRPPEGDTDDRTRAVATAGWHGTADPLRALQPLG